MKRLIIPLIIIGFLLCTVRIEAQNAQVSPVAGLNQQTTSVVNNNFQTIQAGINGVFGLFASYFTNGHLNTTAGGTGVDSSKWASGDSVYMVQPGVWGHTPIGNIAPNTFKFIGKSSMSGSSTSGSIAISSTGYYLVTIAVTFSVSDTLNLTFNSDGNSHYGYVNNGFDFNALQATTHNANTTSIKLGVAMNTSSEVANYYFYIFPSLTGQSFIKGTMWGNNGSGNFAYSDFMGGYTQTSVTSFQINANGADVTGDINLYQIQQS